MAVLGGGLFGGFSLSFSVIEPQWHRLSLMKGLGRMVSLRGFFELFKTLLKFLIVALTAFIVFKIKLEDTLLLSNYPALDAFHGGLKLLTLGCFWL